MIYRRMRTAVWEDTGYYGLVPTWISNANAATGLGVAHDVLEHFSREPGDAEGELLATGAYFLIRCESGWLWWKSNRFNEDPVANLGGSIYEILKCLAERNGPLISPGNTRPLDEGYEETLRAGIANGFKIAESDNIYNEDPAMSLLIERQEALVSPLLGWIRRGVRGAARRYGGWDLSHVAVTFDRLTEASEKTIRFLTDAGEKEEIDVLVWADPNTESAGTKILGHSLCQQDYNFSSR